MSNHYGQLLKEESSGQRPPHTDAKQFETADPLNDTQLTDKFQTRSKNAEDKRTNSKEEEYENDNVIGEYKKEGADEENRN